ncbi:MAG: aspartate aminotransferase family protein [Pirellulaceae bacterium]|nr:aspartate aminotransferase family protein [Pirellulaceae bacterium]
MKTDNSLNWWRQYGKYVLMATRYHDQVIVAVDDCTYRDADGNEYLDLNAGTMCALVGHHHPQLVERMRRQLDEVIHTGTSFLSPVVFQASAKLAEVTPGDLQKSVFFSTGAEANEYALRLARQSTGKSGVLALTKGYSGLTWGMSALTGGGRHARPSLPDVGYLLTPDVGDCPPGRSLNDWMLELFEHSLELNRGLLHNVAAIIVEPIPSTGGMITLPDGFLRLLRSLADEIGALLIVDEAQTGMGRTGKWWGIEHEGVQPDVLVAAKGIGGGFPVSAVITTGRIADDVARRMSHYSSHQSDQLAAAAALAVMEIIQQELLVERAAEMGAYLQAQLDALAARWAGLRGVRGRGLMIGFDVVAPPESPLDETALGEALVEFLHERGVHAHPLKNRFRIMPPLTIGRPQIDRFLNVLEEALRALAADRLRPHGPRSQQAAALVRQRYGSPLVHAAQWAWTHSPQELVSKLRASLSGNVPNGNFRKSTQSPSQTR